MSTLGASDNDVTVESRSHEPIDDSRAALQNVANAALARSAHPRVANSESDGLLSLDLRLPFYRCLDSMLSRPLSNDIERARAMATLATLEVLLSNALHKGVSGPLELKYLQIKLSNPAIRTKLGLDTKQHNEGTGAPALDWLHLCGWR